MSVTVDVDELPRVLGTLDRAAFVCTTGGDGGPKVVHALLTVGPSTLSATVGRGTVANVRAGSAVTLVIPGARPQEMSLLIDADGEATDDTSLALRASAAVWHRSAHGAEQ